MPSPLRFVASPDDIDAALADVRQPGDSHGGAVILVGGATFADAADEVTRGIRRFLATLAAVCQQTGTAVVDGGTDAGVMRWFAEARAAVEGRFPLVGVAPQGAFERNTRTGEPILPADGHSLILTVPGSRFGEESAWLFATADRLGRGSAPSIVVNGGRLALSEARQRIDGGHVVLAVVGSGRAADELAVDEGLLASGRLRVIPMSADEASLADALEDARTS